MAKLSKIFDNLNQNDITKQKYFAQKLVENFMLAEGRVDEAYEIEIIEQKIISEAFQKDSLKESLRFVDGILKQIDEGFVSSIKDLGRKGWEGIKKIGSKIKDALSALWEGSGITEIKKWNKKVSAAATKLESLNDSQIVTESYLLEADDQLELGSTAPSNPTEIPSTNVENTENSGVKEIIVKLAGKIVDQKPSNLPIPGFKVYSITKDEQGQKVLSFANSATDPMVPVIKVMLRQYILVTIPQEIKDNGIELIKSMVRIIRDYNVFGLDKKITDEQLEEVEKKIIKSKAGSTLKIAASKVAFVSDTGTEEPEQSGEETEQSTDQTDTNTDSPTIPENKKILDSAITNSGVMNDADGFYERLGTTASDTWGAFDEFAKNNSYRITDILRNTNGDLNRAAPMNDMEYVAYVANMKPFINALREQPTQPIYDEKSYKVFLNSVAVATDDLADTFNRKMEFDPEEPQGTQKVDGVEPDVVEEPETPLTPQTNDELIKQIDELSQEELQYILSKVEEQ